MKQVGSVLCEWKDMGLPEDRPVHVYDFWNKEYLGAGRKALRLISPHEHEVFTLLPATTSATRFNQPAHNAGLG